MRKAVLATLTVAALIGGVPAANALTGGQATDAPATLVKIENGDHACSGTLVAPQWVLTISGCPLQGATAYLGRRSQWNSDGRAVKIVDQVARTDRGVTLAKLATPQFDLTPVKIATQAPAAGENLQLLGYGRTATEWLPDKPHVATAQVGALRGTEFDLTGSATTCQGDAGGPALRGGELVAVHGASGLQGCYGARDPKPGSTEFRVDDLAGWIAASTPSSPQQLRNAFGNRCAVVFGSDPANGAPVKQFDCLKQYADQVWKLEPTPGGYQVRNAFTDRCMVVFSGGGTGNGQPVKQFDCVPAYADQLWKLEPVAKGGFQLRNAFTNRCLALLSGGGNENGQQLYQWDCVPEYTDQVWKLETV
ncbi:hypothetical protein D5S17_15760 [Pseudonocardiaceae bacterium YIM PH 21723]|nr:hypothetical protein D5S17_15760 [Pseudonocardiaceae bacterium YIM PH 21723]